MNLRKQLVWWQRLGEEKDEAIRDVHLSVSSRALVHDTGVSLGRVGCWGTVRDKRRLLAHLFFCDLTEIRIDLIDERLGRSLLLI